MASFLIELHQIHECLKLICDVESDILNSSFFGLFKKKNYAGNENSLKIACNKLTELHTEIDRHMGASSGVDGVIKDAKNFIHALVSSTKKLIVLNSALALKENGGSYLMEAYNQDLNSFKYLQNQYLVLADRMNENYSLYSHEIALLK